MDSDVFISQPSLVGAILIELGKQAKEDGNENYLVGPVVVSAAIRAADSVIEAVKAEAKANGESP